ncbi:BRCT domain-containing protein [Thozetella sp. PMI_491]|nr:BRCT domain-containing protein [Thozetella sp. PMI_491]
MMIPVVTSDWLKSTITRGKIAQVRPYSPDPRMIFSNVVVTCADIPKMDKEAIIGATMALGGMESRELSRMTTHLVALSMDHPKCQEAKVKNPKCMIILPHWFDDCFKLGKRIQERPYLFPDPEILRQGPEVDIQIPSSQTLNGATSTIPNSLAMPKANLSEDSARGRLVVFAQRSLLLSSDLPINDRLRKILHGLVEDGGGKIVDLVDDCDMFICHYREGEQYVRAAQTCKDVGNLSWLYHLITQNEWSSPLQRLLHYPIPKTPLPGFENLRITLSNYGGDARIYLENLVTASGATFTKTMKADNTHLITARMHSEKCEAAKDWNIDIINHLWIEESYAQCTPLSVANTKYTTFPHRTNLGEVIGQTSMNEKKLQEMFYPGGEEKLDAAAKKKRKINDAAQENALAVGPAEKEFDVMKDMNPDLVRTGTRPQRGVSKEKSVPFTTPAKGRHVRTGKENDTPSITSSGNRSAKAQALTKLHDLAPDIQLYEKEKKRTAKDGLWGGKRAADQIDKDKSSSPAPDRDADDDDEEEAERPAKKRKSLPSVEMRICLTAYKRWVGDKKKEDDDKRKLRKLGIHIVGDNVPCDYLAAPTIVRTMKFLRCLSRGPDVINSSFVDDCLDMGKLPDITKYGLRDKEAEKKFDITMEKSVARARANRHRLLRGVPIFCTPDIKNGIDSYKIIAETNGAHFTVYRARGGNVIKPTTPEEDGNAPPEPVYLLSSGTPAERQLWPKFEEAARKGNMEPRIVVSDWLLDVAMKQQLSFDEKYLVPNWYNLE